MPVTGAPVVQTAPASTDVLAVPVRPGSAPVRLTSLTRRKVASIGWWLVALQGGLLAWVSSQGFPYWDDYLLQGRAAQFPLLSRDLLLYVHDGHVMPAGMAIAWVTVRLAPLSTLGVTVGIVAMQLVASTAVFGMLRTLMGTRPAVLVPLGIYLFSPLILPSSLWWSAALNLLPMQAALAAAITCHVLYLRSGNRKWVVGTLASMLVGLAFFEKSVIIPAALVGVTAAFEAAEGGSPLAGIRNRWRLWLVLAIPVTGYLAVYASLMMRPAAHSFTSGQLGSIILMGVGLAFGPAVAGGPLVWQPLGFVASVASPPGWFVAVVWLGALLLAQIAIWTRPASRWAFLLLFGYLVLDLAIVSVGRAGTSNAGQFAMSFRYTADAAVILAVVTGLLLVAPPRAVEPIQAVKLRAWLARRPGTLRLTSFAVADLYLALCIISAVGYLRLWVANPARDWINHAKASLANADPYVPLLPDPVPDYVLYGLVYPDNLTSHVLAPVSHRPPFAQQTSRLLAFNSDGTLVTARIDGPSAILPQDAGCAEIPAGGGGLVLNGKPFVWEYTAHLFYESSGGPVTIALGDGPPVTVNTVNGQGELAARVIGGGSTLNITPASGSTFCVSLAEVGHMVPTS